MKRLKTRKNPQIQIHQAFGLDWTIHNPTDTRIPVINKSAGKKLDLFMIAWPAQKDLTQ